MNYSWEIIKLIFYLALVLSLIYLVYFLLKRRLAGQKKGRYMQTIEQIYLAPRRSLVLLLVQEEVFLLSLSDSRVELIQKWDRTEFGDLDLKSNQDFKGYLQQIMKGNRRDQDE